MQISGEITAVGQLGPPKGNYNICYQDITIRGTSGREMTGNIGSIKGYVTGTEITVEVTEDAQYGTKFKRIDPQYAKGGSQGGGGKKTEHGDVEGMCRHGVVCAAVQSRQIEVTSEVECDKWVQYIIHGHNKAPQQVTVEKPDQQGVTEYKAPDNQTLDNKPLPEPWDVPAEPPNNPNQNHGTLVMTDDDSLPEKDYIPF